MPSNWVPQAYFGGYVRSKEAIAHFVRTTPRPYLSQQNADIRRSGERAQVRLMLGWESTTGGVFVPHKQLHGTCVGESSALGADFTCIGDILAGDREEWKGKHSVEVQYALSRVEVGGGRIRGDGSTGAWAAEAATRYGFVLRGKYGDYDLTEPRHDLAKLWGDRGCPDELEVIAKQHPIKTATLCKSAAEAADAIANGYPVVVCSNRGFAMTTDKDGFLPPRGQWAHAMLIVGVDTVSDRRAFEIANSWGDRWVEVRGQHKLGTAPGCFWADFNTVDQMLKQGDSYAFSGFDGYAKRELSHVWL